jgi:hypothetical protein
MSGNLQFDGNVGIGTASPARKLHVEHYGSAIGDFEGIRIANHATNLHATSRPAYEFVVSDINSGTGIGHGKFAIGYRDTTSASRTDRLVIDNSGNVGIGTTSPGAKLDVNGVLKNLNPSWSLYFAGSPSPTTSGYLSFNNIKVSARNCTLNTSGGRTSRVTITVAGRYFIGFNGFTESNVSANTGVNYEIRINGTTLVRGYHVQPIANYSAMSGLGGLADLSVNDYVEIHSSHDIHYNGNGSFYGFMIA